jgi:pyrroline-5-carboxylate reductase
VNIAEKLGNIAFIGGGKMGEAIVAGLVQGAMFDPQTIVVVEPNAERREFLAETYAVKCVENGAVLTGIHTCILAVKPQVLVPIATELAASSGFNPVRIISIAAGVETKTLAAIFTSAAVIRVMPNAPLMVGAGMSAVAVAAGTPIAEGELTVALFSLMGEALLLDEQLMNAVTAVSGSGPAYFALLVEELSKAGVALGLSDEQASMLAQQTLIGTARQLQLTSMTPTQLRAAVTSPGGTTQAAIESFVAHDFSGIVASAAKAALQRAEELA